MKKIFSFSFDPGDSHACATIDGLECYRGSYNNETEEFELQMKDGPSQDWLIPKDDADHVFDTFPEVCHAILAYLQNEIPLDTV